MRAIQFSEYGGPGVLTVVERPEPSPGPGQVLVDVLVAGVNPFDVKLRSGEFAGMIDLVLPHVPGAEAVGVVRGLGPGVDAVQVGDRVVGWGDATYAERAVLRTFTRLDAAVPDERAVALPVAGEAALRALRALDLAPTETLLVHGAAGSVGTVAVQVAHARGARVIGTASPAHHAALEALGVRPTAYGPGLVERVTALAPHGIDAVLDAAGHGVLPDAITLRGGTERIVTLADGAAFDLGIPFLSGGADDQTREVLEELLVLAGPLVLPEPRVFDLTDAVAAHEAVAGRGTRGKVVLRVGAS